MLERLFIDLFAYLLIAANYFIWLYHILWYDFVYDCILFSEKAMAPHSSTLAWKIPWTEEPGRLQSMRLLESDTTERLHFPFSLSCIGEDGQGGPVCCDSWGRKESDMTEWLKWTELNWWSLWWLKETDAGCAEDTGSFPGVRRSPGRVDGNLLQDCCRDNPMDTGALWIIVHSVAKSETQLSMHAYKWSLLLFFSWIHSFFCFSF